jgi:hypothetical protein
MKFALYTGNDPAEDGLIYFASIRLWVLPVSAKIPTNKYLLAVRTTFPNHPNLQNIKAPDLITIRNKLDESLSARNMDFSQFDLKGGFSIDLHFSQEFIDSL